MPQDDLLGPTSHPPKPGLGYLCPSPGQVPKKKVSLPGTTVDSADGPAGWSRLVAGTIFYFTCVVVVYQNQSLQMRQRGISLAAEIPPFSVFFGAKIQHVSEHRPYCGLRFWAQKMC